MDKFRTYINKYFLMIELLDKVLKEANVLKVLIFLFMPHNYKEHGKVSKCVKVLIFLFMPQL